MDYHEFVRLGHGTLSLYRRGQPLVVQKMLQQSLNTLATTAITVEEQLTGWYTLLRQQKSREQLARAYRNLVETVVELNQFRLLSFTEHGRSYRPLRSVANAEIGRPCQ